MTACAAPQPRVNKSMSMNADILAKLKAAVGSKGWSDDANEIASHLEEWRGKYHGRSDLLLKPANTDDVSAVLKICNESHVAIVPQGGNTGLVGGQIPFNGEVLLSLKRMNRVREVHKDNMSLIAEAGAILADVQRAAQNKGLYFPLSIASEGSCTIGGNLSTNAGGVNVLRYGNTRDLTLGIEVVLADGRVLNMLRTLRKDNTGYDLKQLFIGAEGTLGIITAGAFKLFPAPTMHATAMLAFDNVQDAVNAFTRLQADMGGQLTSFELIPRIAMELVLAHIPGVRDPFDHPHHWYALAEISMSGRINPQQPFEDAIGALLAGIAEDAIIAQSEAQRQNMWHLRENISEAQKKEGASIKHDVSVPVHAIPALINEGCAAVAALIPGVRPVPFGHMGDGNIHFNFSVPKNGDAATYLARWEEMSRIVHDLVNKHGGSISAEHGLGVLKHNEIARYKSESELDAMRMLKRTLDPNNILNPGKVLPTKN